MLCNYVVGCGQEDKRQHYVNMLCDYVVGCGEEDKETALCEHVM
jgi:hypothetical protein